MHETPRGSLCVPARRISAPPSRNEAREAARVPQAEPVCAAAKAQKTTMKQPSISFLPILPPRGVFFRTRRGARRFWFICGYSWLQYSTFSRTRQAIFAEFEEIFFAVTCRKYGTLHKPLSAPLGGLLIFPLRAKERKKESLFLNLNLNLNLNLYLYIGALHALRTALHSVTHGVTQRYARRYTALHSVTHGVTHDVTQRYIGRYIGAAPCAQVAPCRCGGAPPPALPLRERKRERDSYSFSLSVS